MKKTKNQSLWAILLITLAGQSAQAIQIDCYGEADIQAGGKSYGEIHLKLVEYRNREASTVIEYDYDNLTNRYLKSFSVIDPSIMFGQSADIPIEVMDYDKKDGLVFMSTFSSLHQGLATLEYQDANLSINKKGSESLEEPRFRLSCYTQTNIVWYADRKFNH